MEIRNINPITFTQMQEIATLVKKTPNGIKNLDDTDRKMVKAMLESLITGVRADIPIDFDELKSKFCKTSLAQKSSLIDKIFKGVANFFGWRISSGKLTDLAQKAAASKTLKVQQEIGQTIDRFRYQLLKDKLLEIADKLTVEKKTEFRQDLMILLPCLKPQIGVGTRHRRIGTPGARE